MTTAIKTLEDRGDRVLRVRLALPADLVAHPLSSDFRTWAVGPSILTGAWYIGTTGGSFPTRRGVTWLRRAR